MFLRFEDIFAWADAQARRSWPFSPLCHGDRSLGNAILLTISRFKTSAVAIPLSGKV